MSDDNRNKPQPNMGGAILAGAAIGAAAVLLSDKTKREQTMTKLKDLKQKMNDKVQELNGEADKVADNAKKKIEVGKRKANSKIEEATNM